ncbi:transporter substrate-binding domain-containing protein [uncultured Bifidobacterium sp.]|uniref:transporter substrate-binding domain-containing protein n=1 Tax=uncultured Bifidobacterium sp. TaxID=165187 RepID=UPI00258D8DD4|nr:transporter substrate-binding domain-containing protein [uncultured Bifidobacterium sp.]
MALCPLLATTMLAGCGPTARATANMPEGPAITIGVAADMPGLSRFHDGSYSGFDINVATYVANQLGYAKKQIIFRSVTAANYQNKLSRRTVDFVAAPLPIGTGASSADATYAGPYLNAKQGLLIRTADTKRITSTASLADRNVCTVTGSGAAASIQRRQPAAHIQERDTYLQCVTALLVGEADAISGDDAALAGLAANEGSAYLHVVSDTFGSSLHAISVKTGERALAAKIDTILKQMVRSETWKSFAGQMSDQLRYTPSSKLNPPPIRSDNG